MDCKAHSVAETDMTERLSLTHSLPLLRVRGPLLPRKPQVVIWLKACPFKLPEIKSYSGHLLVTYFSVGVF